MVWEAEGWQGDETPRTKQEKRQPALQIRRMTDRVIEDRTSWTMVRDWATSKTTPSNRPAKTHGLWYGWANQPGSRVKSRRKIERACGRHWRVASSLDIGWRTVRYPSSVNGLGGGFDCRVPAEVSRPTHNRRG